MSINPFDISFGKEPVEIIKRLKQTKDIIDSFIAFMPSSLKNRLT